MKKYLVHIVWVVVAVVAFVGGMYYGKANAAQAVAGERGNFGAFASSTRGFFGRGAGGANGGLTAGQIVSADNQSVTLQLPNGNSEVVFYSSSTQIMKPLPAPASDLTPGTQVIVGGTQNSDGSFTAQTIQIRGTGTSSGTTGAAGQ